MRIKLGTTTQKLAFIAVDSTDHVGMKTGLSSFTVYYSLNGGAASAMTTPTIAELDAANMAGAYVITVDEAGMVSAAGELTLSIVASGMDTVTRVVEISTNLESDIIIVVADVPTVSEFNARTIISDDYVVVGDTIAGVTLVDTCTINSDMVSEAPTAVANADAVWNETISGHVAVGSFGAKNQKVVPSETAADYKADVSALALEANSQSNAAAALTAYDPPTRTEATTDKDAIITQVDGNETKIDAVKVDTASILVDSGTTLPAQITALNDITVADIIAGVADGTNDLQEMMRIMFAALSGKSTGGGTTTLTFRDSADAKARITATVDASGNRTAMTLDGS